MGFWKYALDTLLPRLCPDLAVHFQGTLQTPGLHPPEGAGITVLSSPALGVFGPGVLR